MKVLVIGIFQVAVVFQEYHEQGNQGHTGNKRTGECVPAVHRTVPVRIDAHQPEPGNGRHYGQGEHHDKKGRPNGIIPDIFLTSFNSSDRIIIQAAGKLTHFPAQHRPEYNGQDRGHCEKSSIQETFFVAEDRVFSYVVSISPVVNGMITAKSDCQEDRSGNYTNYRNHSGNRFRHPAESHLPASPCQGSGTDKEHGGIYHQQKEHTVLQQGSPEPGRLMGIRGGSAGNPQSSNRQNTHCHQCNGNRIISLWHFKIFPDRHQLIFNVSSIRFVISSGQRPHCLWQPEPEQQ